METKLTTGSKAFADALNQMDDAAASCGACSESVIFASFPDEWTDAQQDELARQYGMVRQAGPAGDYWIEDAEVDA